MAALIHIPINKLPGFPLPTLLASYFAILLLNNSHKKYHQGFDLHTSNK